MCRCLRTRARLPMLLTRLTAGSRAVEVQKKAANNKLAAATQPLQGALGLCSFTMPLCRASC